MDTFNDNLKQAEDLENKEEYFQSAHYYKQALKLALDKGNSKDIILCKNKCVEMNQKSILSGKDFREISVEHALNEQQCKQLDELIDTFFEEKNTNAILKRIGRNASFIPKISVVKDSANKTIPISYQIVNMSMISNEGHSLRGSEDGQLLWQMSMYDISLQVILILYLNKIFINFMAFESIDKRLTYENLLNYFISIEIIPEKRLEIIKHGLKHFFQDDYISCLHILIPQFESLFLHVSQLCGMDIVALDQKLGIATHTKTLSDKYLETEEFIKVWGEDYCQLIKFVLFEPLGYKLRHKIAHGEILPEECNLQNCTLTLYLFLVILGRIEKINKH